MSIPVPRRTWLRPTAVGLAVLLVGMDSLPGLGAAPAFADSGLTGPPETTVGRPDGRVVIDKDTPFEQQYYCQSGIHYNPSNDYHNPSWGQRTLDLDKAHTISTGAGVRVAVIDTGVSHVARLPHLIDGGDFIQGVSPDKSHAGDTRGGDDCDVHGTLVAGLIAGQADPQHDAFVGVAPDAEIVTIRQSSGMFHIKNGNQADAAGNILSLARAVVIAADMGSQVINVSIDSCFPAEGYGPGTPIYNQDQQLGAALKYAAEEKDAVIVVAAGNVGSGGSSNKCSPQNPDYDATQHYDPTKPHDTADPLDPTEWKTLRTIASPAWWMQYVLAVGWVSRNGQPAGVNANPRGEQQDQSSGTVAGPWVGIAAPGDEVISLNPRPSIDLQGKPNYDLTDGVPNNDPTKPPERIQGTSFAAPIVSGAAALLRAQHPDWNHQQIIEQLERTAIHPPRGRDNFVGYGLIDIVAALTERPGTPGDFMQQYATKQLQPPAPDPLPDHRSRNFAVTVGAVALLLLVVGAVISIPLRHSRRTGAGGES